MKILHINKTDSGGGASVAAMRIHQALLSVGADSHLLVERKFGNNPNVQAVGQGRAYNVEAFCRFVYERLRIFPYETDSLIRYNFSIANTGISIKDHPLVKEADVINFHWINQGFLSLHGIEDVFSLRKPVIWTLHDMWPFTGGCHYAGNCLEFNEHCGYCPMLKNRNRDDFSSQVFKRKKTIYSKSNLTIVTCSNWLNTLARNSSLLRTHPVYTIPNPIDTEIFVNKDKQQCRHALGLPLDKKLILFGAANVFDPRKGFRYLEEALTILQENFPQMSKNIEIVTFGKAKHRYELDYPIHSFDYVNSTETLVKLYNSADMFILPSLQDNLPNTVVESLCCGTPVIGFRTGGIPEIISHNETGFLADVKNSLSLANGIYNLLFSVPQGIRKEAVERYSNETVAQQYLEVYEKAIKR